MSFTQGLVLKLPGLEVTPDNIAVMSLDKLAPIGGWHVDGVLGNDVLREFTVRIDYAAKLMTLYRPDAYHVPDGAAVLPLAHGMFTHTVRVAATVTLPGLAPADILCAIDTGASSTTLNSPFVDSSGAIQAVGRTLSRPAYGAGDAHFDTLSARISGFKLGPYLLVNPVVGLSRAKDGVLASDDIQGILGNDVFQRFTLTLDYHDDQLILEPNAALGTPFLADASGLLIIATGDDLRSFEVTAVLPDSPGLEAGLQSGDVIEKIDGGPAARFRLSELKQMLTQDGHNHALTVRRGAQHLDVQLKLRRLI